VLVIAGAGRNLDQQRGIIQVGGGDGRIVPVNIVSLAGVAGADLVPGDEGLTGAMKDIQAGGLGWPIGIRSLVSYLALG